ncbi:MAG TPA: SpoIIE family protein phosphatase [Allosphingosinicella sp.]|nr:SpoIIE family protein phosphatase [Allosphingosinicella sp.]
MRNFEPDRPAGTAPADISRSLSVLVAEDDPLVAEYLAMAVEDLGCRAEAVTDGQAALARLRAESFDVLISDWMMPEMDGVELIRHARAEQEGYLHIIMMTALGEERTIRTALEAGADDFLYKPVEDIQIELGIAAARRVVELQRRLQRRNRHLAAAHERTRAAYGQIKEDLTAAAKMQRRLLPETKVTGPVRFAYAFQPSLDIGGDSLGVVPLSNGRWLFFDIDVSGHGVPAALNSFALHSRLTHLGPAEPEQLAQVASLLSEELLAQQGDAYCTTVIGLAEADGSKVWLLRAGHPMPLLMRGASAPSFLPEGGLPLGMLPGASHPVIELDLEPGDRLLIYSDGVTEGGLGEEGLQEACHQLGPADLSSMIGALEWRLLHLRRGRPPEDDISMLAIERSQPELF